MILCPKCQKNEAPMHPQFGPMWCEDCNKSIKPMSHNLHEWTTDDIKQGRRDHHDALIQPYRDGDFSREFRDAHPQVALGMVKSGVITEKQFNNAKPVWRGDELR